MSEYYKNMEKEDKRIITDILAFTMSFGEIGEERTKTSEEKEKLNIINNVLERWLDHQTDEVIKMVRAWCNSELIRREGSRARWRV